MRYSIRHLQVFASVARAGNVSAAADELAMSQSAASAALLELERRYGQPLFDRVGKRLRINETGRALVPAAHNLLDRGMEIDALLDGRSGPGSLKLGATQTIGNYIVPRLIEIYARRYPASSVTLEIDNTAGIAARVADFSLDFALIEGECAHPDLALTDWIEDRLVLICNPSHPLAGRNPSPIDALLAERWAVREPGSGTRQTLDRAMRPWWTRWRIGIELQQLEAIVETVAVSAMIGCVSELAAYRPLQEGRVVELQVPDLDLRRRSYLVVHKEKYRSAGVGAFFDICTGVRVDALRRPARNWMPAASSD